METVETLGMFGFAFEKSQTMFRVGKPPFQSLIRNISLANHFSVPLVLYDIRLSSKAQDYFTVSLVTAILSLAFSL